MRIQKWEKPLDLVQSVMGLFTKRIESEGIRAVVDISPEWVVFVDRDRIKQVLINLILNAIEAMADSQEKQLTIQAKQDGKKVCLAISDIRDGHIKIVNENLYEDNPLFKSEVGGGFGISTIQLDNGKVLVNLVLEKIAGDGLHEGSSNR